MARASNGADPTKRLVTKTIRTNQWAEEQRRLPLPYAINLRHNRIEKRLTAGAAPDRHRSRKIGDHGYPPLDAPKHVICHTDGKAVSY